MAQAVLPLALLLAISIASAVLLAVSASLSASPSNPSPVPPRTQPQSTVPAAKKLTPKEALARVRANSRPEMFDLALARLRRLLAGPETAAAQAQAAAADSLGRAAAGPCSGGGPQPAIAGLWQGDDQLLHDALIAQCSSGASFAPPPPLLLMVNSEASDAGAGRRADVRRTWGSRRGVAMAFFLGRAASGARQAAIDGEAKRYGDIVQFRLPDGPAGGTERHLATLEWGLTRCRGARHLVHVDDTVFVDVIHLTSYLSAGRRKQGGILCSPRHNSNPQRSPRSQWYVSKKDFPDPHYPLYCDTSAYVVSNDSAAQLLACALVRRPLWIDDVYVTGVLREAADVPLAEFPPGHGHGWLLPSDTRDASGAAADLMFLSSERPQFNRLYWPGLWRSTLLRECSLMLL